MRRWPDYTVQFLQNIKWCRHVQLYSKNPCLLAGLILGGRTLQLCLDNFNTKFHKNGTRLQITQGGGLTNSKHAQSDIEDTV